MKAYKPNQDGVDVTRRVRLMVIVIVLSLTMALGACKPLDNAINGTWDNAAGNGQPCSTLVCDK